MAIDFATFLTVAPHVLNSRLPVLIRGRHGVGKSEVVYMIAEQRELPVVERRASQMTEGDLVGLPSTDGNTTSFNPPDWFKTACDNPVVLFLDEVDRATIEVRQGIFELTDSRKLNGHVLHKDTLIFAAVNGGEHGDQYQVGEMDPAELKTGLLGLRIRSMVSSGISSTRTATTWSTLVTSSLTRYTHLVVVGCA